MPVYRNSKSSGISLGQLQGLLFHNYLAFTLHLASEAFRKGACSASVCPCCEREQTPSTGYRIHATILFHFILLPDKDTISTNHRNGLEIKLSICDLKCNFLALSQCIFTQFSPINCSQFYTQFQRLKSVCKLD